MATAFQQDAFQDDAFQIDVLVGPFGTGVFEPKAVFIFEDAIASLYDYDDGLAVYDDSLATYDSLFFIGAGTPQGVLDPNEAQGVVVPNEAKSILVGAEGMATL